MSTAIAQKNENWTLEITPSSSMFYIPFQDIWRYRDLLFLFVRRDFVSFYKQTVLGPIWFFLQPLFTTLIFTVVFGGIAKMAPEGVPPMLFYLCGVTFWNYVAECLNKTATTFKDNANLFGKVYFPRIIVPLSIVCSNLVRLAVQFGLFLAIWIYHLPSQEVVPQKTLLLFPLVILIMAVLSLGLGMLFSAMTTKYRDLFFLLQFGVQLLMYGSAVIYPLSKVGQYERYLAWNPLVPMFETLRHGFLGTGSVDYWGLGYAAAVALGVFLISCVVFNRIEKTFMDTV